YKKNATLAFSREILFFAQLLDFVQHSLERNHRSIAALCEGAIFIVDIGDAAAHTGSEVSPRATENDDGAAGHVFAAVIAGAFDDGRGPRIAHAEALAGDAAEIRLAGDRAVHHGVADHDVVFGPC